MPAYLCRMDDVDGFDDWTEILAMDAEDAALEYTDKCESQSGGEMLNDPWKDFQIVRVRCLDSMDKSILSFRITMEWYKTYDIEQVPTL